MNKTDCDKIKRWVYNENEVKEIYFSRYFSDKRYVVDSKKLLDYLKTLKDERCEWHYDAIDCNYETDCGEAFCFNYHPPENEFKFCPYCSKEIKFKEEG